jgi:maltooligosyltrehalose synthase
MQREHVIRRLAKLEGYRLQKKGDDNYRLMYRRFNFAVYRLDGVRLEKIAAFLEQQPNKFVRRS